MMLTTDLYEYALIRPADQADRLFIVSGYASATFARRHLQDLVGKKRCPEVNLIIGMPDSRGDHLAFVELHKEFENKFKAYYLKDHPPVHCKMYAWFRESAPEKGFAGSANYTQYGFLHEKQQKNQLSDEDPLLIRHFFKELRSRCVPLPEAPVPPVPSRSPKLPGPTEDVPPGGAVWVEERKVARISFLQSDGGLPEMSGPNWGQRSSGGRSNGKGVNEAYLPLKGKIAGKPYWWTGWTPTKATRFTLITDDDQTFDCVTAQDYDKVIVTTDNNSLLGIYLRNRWGVREGALVTRDHLNHYGRTDYTLIKLDDETFMLDLSVSQ
jgi:hypothetical protein